MADFDLPEREGPMDLPTGLTALPMLGDVITRTQSSPSEESLITSRGREGRRSLAVSSADLIPSQSTLQSPETSCSSGETC